MAALYQIIKQLILPPSCIFVLLLAGFILSLIRFKRLGRVILGLSIFLFYLLSISPTADWLLAPLESGHRAITAKQVPRTGTLVVLGGGAFATADLPASSRLTQGSIQRLLEAVRLYHLMDQPKIVLSGGSGNPFVKVSVAEIMREVLLNLRIPKRRIVIESESRNTYENATAVQRLKLTRPLILITTAAHMDRALRVFRALKMKPLPAPCDFKVHKNEDNPLRFFPSAGALANSNAAIYEYLGTWWYGLTGKF